MEKLYNLSNYETLVRVVNMVESVIRKIDKLGRITIPAEWRKDLGEKVILIREKDFIKIVKLKDFKFSDLFDSIEFSGTEEEWLNAKKMKRRILNEISRL